MTRLERRLDTSDAVVVGPRRDGGRRRLRGPRTRRGECRKPAPRRAGPRRGGGTCNALSSAQLAAEHPASGGTYVYGRERLGPFWGWLAGYGFVVGKTASCAAMALTFGAYAVPGAPRVAAAAAVVALTAVDLRGVVKTARMTRVLLALVLLTLGLVFVAALSGGTADAAGLRSAPDVSLRDVLESAGLLFFAFAGYARIATLGEEVIDSARTIPRAIPLALALALALYALVAVAALLAVGPTALAASPAPLATAVEAGRWAALAPVVRAGAAVAAVAVLLSLLAGVSRTVLAMARTGDLPRALRVVHPTRSVPQRAQLAVSCAVLVLVLVVDLRAAIGFSSLAVLAYYAIATAGTLQLRPDERRWPPAIAVVGLTGCLSLALSLPASSVTTGGLALAVGAGGWLLLRRRPG